MAAALEAKKAGLAFAVFEATEAFSTIVELPEGQADLHLPDGMTPAGELQFRPRCTKESSARGPREGAASRPGSRSRHARIERIERQGDDPAPPPRRRRDRDPRPARDRRDRPQRQLTAGSASPARSSTRSSTASTIRRTSRAGRCSSSAAATRRSRPRSRSPGRRARHALLPQEGVRAAQARERREAPDARAEPVGAGRVEQPSSEGTTATGTS